MMMHGPANVKLSSGVVSSHAASVIRHIYDKGTLKFWSCGLYTVQSGKWVSTFRAYVFDMSAVCYSDMVIHTDQTRRCQLEEGQESFFNP